MTPDQAKFVLDEVLMPQLKAEYKTTLKVLQAVPADKGDYSPDGRSMNGLDLAWHLASVDVFFVALVLNGGAPEGDGKRPESIQTPADVAPWYAETFPNLLEQVSALSGEQLNTQIPFYSFNETGLAYLQLMQSHSIHHRGQLSAYLRPMGGKVPAIYGGSADEPMASEAASA